MLDQFLGLQRDFIQSVIGVIKAGLLIEPKGAVEPIAAMSPVGADNGKSARQCRRPHRTEDVTQSGRKSAVKPTSAMKSKPAVPFCRQAQIKAQSELAPVYSQARIEHPLNQAMLRKQLATVIHRAAAVRCRRGSGGNNFRFFHHEARHGKVRKSLALRGFRGFIRTECGSNKKHSGQYGADEPSRPGNRAIQIPEEIRF